MWVRCPKPRIRLPTENRRGRVRVSRGIVNMAARCGGYAVRPMAWPMLLHWDGCGWNRNNGMPTQAKRIGVEA
ncbi:hypothetical protein MUP07_07835 [Candidatus Bathyarchaeota archaeon]|nr:hypothetical protein [Candidatus Bathyarchaeota archaeon]